MTDSGLNYLLQFCKIQKGERIGNIEALGFETLNNASQMGHLIINCKCHKSDKIFKVSASLLNWKITKFQKGALRSLDYKSIGASDGEKY